MATRCLLAGKLCRLPGTHSPSSGWVKMHIEQSLKRQRQMPWRITEFPAMFGLYEHSQNILCELTQLTHQVQLKLADAKCANPHALSPFSPGKVS